MAEGERLAPQEEPDTFDVPLERLGLPWRLACGCRLVCAGEAPRPPKLSSSSLLGVGVGMESCRNCSEEMKASGGSAISAIGAKAAVPGWNSRASGLKEKFLKEATGVRLTWPPLVDGGARAVEALDRRVDASTSLPRSLAFLIARYVASASGILRDPSEGKYDTRPLNFNTSALALTKPQQPRSSAYCSLQARYSQSLLMSSNGLLTQDSSSNWS
jgi:hypothetical protein